MRQVKVLSDESLSDAVIISPHEVRVISRSPELSSTGLSSGYSSSPALSSIDILCHRPLPPIPGVAPVAIRPSSGTHISFSSSTTGPVSYSSATTSLFQVLPEIRSNPLWQQPLHCLVERIRREFSLTSSFLTNIQVIEKACHEVSIHPTRLYKVDAVKVLIRLGITVTDL
jgi:hypothetical protein